MDARFDKLEKSISALTDILNARKDIKYIEEEMFDIPNLTMAEAIHYSTDNQSTTSAVIDNGCPSTLAGHTLISKYLADNDVADKDVVK